MTLRCADTQPDAELEPPLDHQVAHHSVDADRSHHESKDRERYQYDGSETRLRHRNGNKLFHRLDLIDRHGAIDCGNGTAHVCRHRCWVDCRAHDDGRSTFYIGCLRKGHVHFGASFAVQAIMENVSDDADHCTP